MDVLRIRVGHADGRVEELVTEAPRVLIGTGSHCEIRLPIGTARVEHVLIQSSPAGWRATARSFDPAPTLDGVEFNEVPIRGDGVIGIGRTRIELFPFTTADGVRSVTRTSSTGNSRVFLYVALGVAAWFALRMMAPQARSVAREPAKVPALWGTAVASCPQTAREAALAAANARVTLALTKRERSPFRPDDGVAAVPLYESAAACFRIAGRPDDAADATAAASALRQELSDEFQVHRLRLQRALASEEWLAADHEIGALLGFLPADGGEYVNWLSNLRRKLQLQYGSKRKAKS
ncbi:MAG: hypothetical protein FWD17_01310 [Polyangiaceae bacterium]|nr:hypothetical protein [Polyangiaceae bacterium]